MERLDQGDLVRRKPFRITEPWAKLIYILVGWFGVPWGLRLVLGTFSTPALPTALLDTVWGFVVVYVGSRAFRAAREPVDPARVWWRATGRPAAGFWLAGFFLLGLLVFLLPSSFGVIDTWSSVVSSLVIGVFYLHSSIRLVRGDAEVPPRAPGRADADARLIRPDRRLSR